MKGLLSIMICFLGAVFLSGCAVGREGEIIISEEVYIGSTESIIETTINVSDMETTTSDDTINMIENMSDVYFRLSYTRDTVDIGEVMHAILLEEKEKDEFDKTEMKQVEADGGQIQKGSMTIDGVFYQWMVTDRGLSYITNRETETISKNEAEEIAQHILAQLKWESSDEIEFIASSDGEVKMECRFCYEGVKIMGNYALYFDNNNSEEAPTYGSYLSLTVSGSGVRLMDLAAPPQINEVLQTYDWQEDFLKIEGLKTIVNEYCEISNQSTLSPLTLNPNIKVAEIIYMPFKDATYGDVLIPVFEVRIANDSGNAVRDVLLYVDALTGYIYDEKYILDTE